MAARLTIVLGHSRFRVRSTSEESEAVASGDKCAREDSNLRPRAPEARALSPELRARGRWECSLTARGAHGPDRDDHDAGALRDRAGHRGAERGSLGRDPL